MPIWLHCPCGKLFVIRDKMRGHTGTCQQCGRRILAIDGPEKPIAESEKLESEEPERLVTPFPPEPKRSVIHPGGDA